MSEVSESFRYTAARHVACHTACHTTLFVTKCEELCAQAGEHLGGRPHVLHVLARFVFVQDAEINIISRVEPSKKIMIFTQY